MTIRAFATAIWNRSDSLGVGVENVEELMSNVTFVSDSHWTRDGVRVVVEAREHRWIVDEPTELGGRDQGPNPVELVLGGLGSCLTVLAASFAPRHGVELRDFRVIVEGDLDPDGFLGLSPIRPGFQDIRYRFEVDSPSPAERVHALLEHIQRVCPVKDTLRGVSVTQANGSTSAGRASRERANRSAELR